MQDLTQFIGVLLASALGAGAIVNIFVEKAISAGIEKSLHKQKMLSQAEFLFRQRQLEELYGPVYACLQLSLKIYPLWMDGKFKEVNLDIIQLFKRQNDEITTILKTKAHLIDGGEYPIEFTKFMTSATIWSMYCTREEEPWLPAHVAEIEDVKWPVDFERHIFMKTEELKKRLDELLHKYQAM